MACTCAQYLSTSRVEDTATHRAKIFNILVLQGKLRSAVRWITNRDNGRIFHLGDIYPKTVKHVLEFLLSNHSGTCPPTAGMFKAYGFHPPAFVPVDVTGKTVHSVA